jgi:serine/threonine-protein kinase
MSPRRDFTALVRESLGDRFTIESVIGRGGAATVFLARPQGQAEDGEPLALKVLHPELAVTVTAKRFVQEIRLLRGLDHPHIGRLLDSGETDLLVYYTSVYVPGPTLRQHLDRVRRASVSDTMRIARDLLDALSYAHARDIVHRDVKPENIVLDRAGPTLVDFGIAKAIAEAGTTRLTRSGFTVGTSTYMSPEQVAGEPHVDARSDLYSLACVLFECLAGRPPFHHRQEHVVLSMQQNEPAPDVRTFRDDTPEPLAHAIARALEKQLDQRWPSAEAMHEEIRKVGAGAS